VHKVSIFRCRSCRSKDYCIHHVTYLPIGRVCGTTVRGILDPGVPALAQAGGTLVRPTGRRAPRMPFGGSWAGWNIEDSMDAADCHVHRYDGQRTRVSPRGMGPLGHMRPLGLAA